MTQERDVASDRARPQTTTSDHSVPGKASASAQLASPDRPLVSGILMRKGGGAPAAHAEAAVAQAATGGGDSLPGELRERFESSLGTDLSSVRVHQGGDSAAAAEAVSATAYATGDDIHFAAGQYDPHSAPGQELIAHEVAHTVQQRGGSPTRQHKLAVSQPGDAFEGEADRAAQAMVRGAPATVTGADRGIARSAENSMKPGSGKPEPKRDSDKASVAEGTVDIKLFGREGKIKCTKDGVGGGLKLTKLPPAEETLFKMDKAFPIQLGMGGGVMLKATGAIKATAAAAVEASGGTKDFGGPREDTIGYEGKVTATGSMGITATGRIEILGYIGAGFANINGGGYVELSANASASLTGGGGFELYPGGAASGNLSAEFAETLTVKGTGGITIGWEALVASGKFYEVELVSHEFLTGKLGKKATFDIGSGAGSTADTSEPLQWKPIRFSEPKQARTGIGAAAKKAGAVADKMKADAKAHGDDWDKQECEKPEPCNPDNQTCQE